MPYFTCTEYGTQCVKGCGSGNTACEHACRVDNPCGATNPTRVNITTTSSAAAGATKSADPNKVQNGFGGAEETPASSSNSNNNGGNSKSGGSMAVDLGRSYGLAVVFAGVFAGFALVL
jgi:hypothetical protein